MTPDDQATFAVYVCGLFAMLVSRLVVRAERPTYEPVFDVFADALVWPMAVLFLVVDLLLPAD